MSRVLTVLVLFTLGQFFLGYLLLHFGLIAVAGMSWWAWSWFEGRRRG